MTDDTELTKSPAAERMRRHRERRRDGLRCLTIELRETEIDVLLGKKADARNDPDTALMEFKEPAEFGGAVKPMEVAVKLRLLLTSALFLFAQIHCFQHRETTVMDAVKNVLGFDK